MVPFYIQQHIQSSYVYSPVQNEANSFCAVFFLWQAYISNLLGRETLKCDTCCSLTPAECQLPSYSRYKP
jgi:hypothetical protein